MLTFSAADFEDFLEPRPELSPKLEPELTDVVRLLAQNRWPFRLHATYEESISRFLDVFEAVDREVPFNGLHWFFDHAETVGTRSLERIKALGGGIAIQHRMAYQGEYFVSRYGAEKARTTPPVAEMLRLGIPVSAGTDATRVASYNPWVCLSWLTNGRTVGGLPLYDDSNLLDRERALRLYTQAAGWFSNEEGVRGTLREGQLADLAVLSADYFSVSDEQIKHIESVLTIVGGKIVHGSRDFLGHNPPPLPTSPNWSPVGVYGGYHSAQGPLEASNRMTSPASCSVSLVNRWTHSLRAALRIPASRPRFGLECDCFAF